MMNVDHEDWRLPSEVDLTKDLSTCARPGLQDSLSQYSQHIHPTNHSPTTHWLTFKAEIAVSEWVSVPCASVECQHVDQVTIPGYISLELKIRCRGWILFSPKNILLLRRNTWWQLGWWHSCAVKTKDSSNPITESRLEAFKQDTTKIKSLASEDQCFVLFRVVHLSLLRKLSTALTSLDYERSFDISGKNNIILLRMKERGHLLLRSKGSCL